MSINEAAHEQQPSEDTPPASPAGGPPDLATAATEAEFMNLLRELRKEHADLSYKKIARLWQQKYGKDDARERSTVAEKFKKNRLPRPKQLEQLLTLLAGAAFTDPHARQRYVQRGLEHGKCLLQSRERSRADPSARPSLGPAAPGEEDPDAARLAAAADVMARLRRLLAHAELDQQKLARQWKKRYPADAPDEFERNWWRTGQTVPTWKPCWATQLKQLVTLLTEALGVEEDEIRHYLEHGQGVLQTRIEPPDDTAEPTPVYPAADTEAEFMALLREIQARSSITCRQLAERWRTRFPRCDPPRQDELEEWVASTTLPDCWGGAVGSKYRRLQPLVTLLVEAHGGSHSEIRHYVHLGRALLARRTQHNVPPTRPAQDPPAPAAIDDPPTELVPVIRIHGQDTGEQCADAGHSDAPRTEPGPPQRPAQPQPRSMPVRALGVLMCLLRLRSSGITTLLTRIPWWRALGILVGIGLLVAVGGSCSLLHWL